MTKMELSLPLCVVKGEYLAVNGAAASAWARRICLVSPKMILLCRSACVIFVETCVYLLFADL